MTFAQRQRIGRAFSGASLYDRHARVQRLVAEDLAGTMAGLALPAAPAVLEIGCGTGFLTEAAAARGIAGEWLVTDLSPEMVERCRERIGSKPGYHFAVLDGETGARPPEAPFDLICANLALQWFADLTVAVSRLTGWLKPGGHLVFTTLAAGTFAEWRAAHEGLGQPSGLLALPSFEALRQMHGPLQRAPHQLRRYVDEPGSARAFLHDLKAIGAATPAPGHQPLRPGTLRAVMRAFEHAGARASYEVVTCHYGASA